MLGQIALRGFENGEYFFQKEDLQRQIECICNLPNSDDSEDMLKAIEYHHGLLVERAKNIYSFSHLTFQEYFTAREIERERHFEKLMHHITDPQWKEVFLLTAEMLRRSDDFLRLMKEYIDGILAGEEKLQAFLEWANKKANSVKTSYKIVAVRAFYAFLSMHLYKSGMGTKLTSLLDVELAQSFKTVLSKAFKKGLDLAFDFHLTSACLGHSVSDFSIALNHALAISDCIDNKPLIQMLFLLNKKLLDLKVTSPEIEITPLVMSPWWQTNRKKWTDELLKVCADCRNIGHDWQFTKEQLKFIEQYYEANLLLVECMNRSNISEQIREEIESTLLLPISSIPNTEL
jgi:predicted NACHT family NTPase